jgi:hypothetical protein
VAHGKTLEVHDGGEALERALRKVAFSSDLAATLDLLLLAEDMSNNDLVVGQLSHKSGAIDHTSPLDVDRVTLTVKTMESVGNELSKDLNIGRVSSRELCDVVVGIPFLRGHKIQIISQEI